MPPFQLSMPTMHRISQSFDVERLDSIEPILVHQLNGTGLEIPHGKEIAITAGSRGIANLESILRSIVQWVTYKGGIPFLVPAMGSHGGGHRGRPDPDPRRTGNHGTIHGLRHSKRHDPRLLTAGRLPSTGLH